MVKVANAYYYVSYDAHFMLVIESLNKIFFACFSVNGKRICARAEGFSTKIPDRYIKASDNRSLAPCLFPFTCLIGTIL